MSEHKDGKWERFRRVHGNSVEAYYAGKLHGIFSDREDKIIHCLRAIKQGTDRQIKEWLSLKDMNDVRPRVTELITKAKLLEEIGSVKDSETGLPVRVVRIIPKDNAHQMTFF